MKVPFRSIFLRRVCSCLLLLGLLFAFPLNASAEVGDLNTIDLDFTATSYNAPDSNLESTTYDVTNDTNVYIYNVSGRYKGMVCYELPHNSFSTQRVIATVVLDNDFSFNSNHEYNLTFSYAGYVSLPLSCVCQLTFYDSSGNVIKEQYLYNVNHSKDEAPYVYNVDIDFKPDISDIEGGYKCVLQIGFVQNGFNSETIYQRFFVSPTISLTDKDDDSGWFQKILNKINDVWESVKSLPEKVGSYISSLGDRIDEAFQVVGDGIVDGVREALQWAFVPSEEYLDGFADSWQSWFESHFGVFSQVTNFLVDMIGEFEDLFTGNYSFVFPEVSVPIMDKNIVLIEEQTVDIAQWLEAGSFGARLYEIYTTCVWAIIIYCVMKYALVVQDIIFAGNRMVLNET